MKTKELSMWEKQTFNKAMDRLMCGDRTDLLKRRQKWEPLRNKQQLKEAGPKSITKEDRKGFVMSAGRRLDTVIASKGFATKY